MIDGDDGRFAEMHSELSAEVAITTVPFQCQLLQP